MPSCQKPLNVDTIIQDYASANYDDFKKKGYFNPEKKRIIKKHIVGRVVDWD